jgi:hypothetical protein
MPVAAAARFTGVTDKRLWRVIAHYVGRAVAALDLSAVHALASTRRRPSAATTM